MKDDGTTTLNSSSNNKRDGSGSGNNKNTNRKKQLKVSIKMKTKTKLQRTGGHMRPTTTTTTAATRGLPRQAAHRMSTNLQNQSNTSGSKGGLPSISSRAKKTTGPSEDNEDDDDDDDASNGAVALIINNNKSNFESFSDEDEDDEDALETVLACDTRLLMQSLQAHNESCIGVPVSSVPPFLKTVLECQLRRRLDDSVVSQELRDMCAWGLLCRLSAPRNPSTTGDDPFSVLLTKDDYVRGVRDAESHKLQNMCPSSISTDASTCAVDWFVRNLTTFAVFGERIPQSFMERTWKRDPLKGWTLSSVLKALQAMQVLLANHQYDSYQLWLPSWGVVIQAWNEAKTKLLQQLSRSSFRERSETALQQPYSPIPTPVLIQWLVDQGKVEIAERPSGRFIQLLKN